MGYFYGEHENLKANTQINKNKEKYILELNNFSCIDCPILEIYLSPSFSFNLNESIFVGKIKRPIGSQEYTLEIIEIQNYKKIILWDKEKKEIYGSSYFQH